jgi:hypothetical protein
MQDRPSIDELLGAVAGFLEDDVMANTTGRINFHARVSVNVLQMIRRELNEQESHLATEWEGLSGLLGPVERPATISGLAASIEERNRQLSGRIRDGHYDDAGDGRERLIEHLRRVTFDKLVVSNPSLAEEAASSGQ